VSLRIAVVDYGIGNLRSVERALLHAGAQADITGDGAAIRSADGVVLPGVGAFGAALDALDEHRLRDTVLRVAASGRPLLGVCLGHQLLFDWSDESGGRAGLALLPGHVARLDPAAGKVPHMGWNQLRLRRASPLLTGLDDGAYAYFVHSYVAREVPDEAVIAECDYGGPLAAVVQRDNVFGTQFHPEKSGGDGLRIYANFVALCGVPARL
jgi:glutamine amidotransferase